MKQHYFRLEFTGHVYDPYYPIDYYGEGGGDYTDYEGEWEDDQEHGFADYEKACDTAQYLATLNHTRVKLQVVEDEWDDDNGNCIATNVHTIAEFDPEEEEE